MSSVDEQLITRIRTETGFPVYVGEFPAGVAFPAVVVERLSLGIDPQFARNASVEDTLFAVHLWAESSADRLSNWISLRNALDRWQDTGVYATFIENVVDNYEPDKVLFQRTADVRIFHDEDT